MKLNVVLRTCDGKSIQGDRVVPKDECVVACSTSLARSLRYSGVEYAIHVIDDNSSEDTRSRLRKAIPEATFDLLEPREESHLNGKQRSRHSVAAQPSTR